MYNCNFNQVAKALLFSIVTFFALGSFKVQAQVTTNSGSGLAATYPSLSAAITALNAATISSPVVITLTGNETAPVGGYSITAQGTTTNTIIIEGSSSTITAATGLTAGALNDAIFKLVGADNVTIRTFTMQENAANTTIAPATNNMTEWGVALLYATTTDGCQNISILNNTISLGSTYQNAFGIYANSTHSLAAVTTSATATGTLGGNHNLSVKGNTISNVHMGVVVVGPTAAADHIDGLSIGGTTLAEGNTITFGSASATATSGYANLSLTVNGILVRNAKNITVSNNGLTSNGTALLATLNGIQIQAFSNIPTGTFTQNINNNTFNLRSNIATGSVNGISQPSGSASTTSICNINNNNFTNFGHSTATASGTLTFINDASTHLTTAINGNTFTNITVNTTGSVTFISHSFSMPTGGTKSVSNNAIITAFTKSGAGGTVTFMTTGGSSPNASSGVYSNNTISNITLTGATTFIGISDSDGSGSAPNKIISGNTIGSITTGAATMTGINVTYWGGTTSSISGNSLLNFNGQSTITGITLGSSFSGATNSVVSGNNIAGLFSTGTGGSVVGLTCSNTSTGITITGNNIGTLSSTGASAVTALSVTGAASTVVSRNVICSLTGNNASSTVNGILVSSGTIVTITNNVIGGLDAPIANAANPVNGINVTGGTTVNVYYNTVRVTGTSSAALFGSSALSMSTTPTVVVRNNIFVNNGTPVAAGICTAYRRSTTTLTTFDNTSNNNDLVGSTLYTDGTNTHTTLAAYQGFVTPREALSITVAPTFLSTSCGNANFLHLDPSIFTAIESGGANISGLTTDIDGQTRAGNAGYTGTGSAPDLGADEVETALPLCSGAEAGSVATSTVNLCTSAPTTTLTATGVTIGSGLTLQWKVSSTPGGPYVNVIGGSGANTTTFTTPSLPAGTYYFVMQATCSVGPVSDLTNEVTVNVYTNPIVSVTPSSAAYCSPLGSAVSLTATGAVSYAWSPSAGLSATTGTTVNASPSATTTYTVSGTDANGCIGTATTAITSGVSVTSFSPTATPPSVCSGGTSQLAAVANVAGPVNQYVFAAGTGATLQDMTGSTQVIGASNDDTPTATAAAIGFNFLYNGTLYSQYSVSPDGWILLGGAVASSQFTNAVTSTTNIPKIYPYWDDMATGTDGNVKVLVTGTAPNRIMVVQWFVTIPRNTAGAANSTIQAWLYESSGKIEFKYGTLGTATSGTISAGLTASATNYQSLSFATNTASTSVANDANAANPATGTVYTFTLPVVSNYVWTPSTFLNNAAIANPIASGVTATTTYNVVASNGGCSTSSTVTITAGSALTSSATLNTASTVCAGINVIVTGTGIGGGAPYTYAWTGPNSFTSTSGSFNLNTITVAQAGTYTVVVTDACGATSTSTVNIAVNALPIVGVTSSSSLYCSPGTGVTLTATGASTYAWSPAGTLSAATGASVVATPSSTTTYTVVGTDGNACSASATVAITYAPAIATITATATPTSVCANGTSNLVASAALSPYTYCTSTHSSGCSGDNISAVVLGTINNTTGTTCGGTTHQSYFVPSATTTTTLSALTASNTLSVSFGTDGNQYFGAWIDYNQDGSLDASEFLGASGNAGASGTTSITFAVPTSAYNGTTRLRIVGGNDAAVLASQACGASSSTWGETQDYDVTISNATEMFTYAWSPATNLSATTGTSVTASGLVSTSTYTATATSLAGCTKTGNVTVTVRPTSASVTNITACSSYTWTNGITYTTSGTHTQTLVNAVGCDSIATLNVTIHQPSTSSVNVTACGSYTWAQNGTTYTTSGAYPVVLTGANAAGCDSTITLNLTINQPSTATVNITACDSYSWPLNLGTYTTSGFYTTTLLGANAVGCDSVVTLNLTINHSTTGTDTQVACESYQWIDGVTYTSSNNTATHTLTNAVGCDSIVTLNLTINHVSTYTDVQTACSSYTWMDGVTYTSSTNTPTFILTNAAGCDSVITLDLTINLPSSNSIELAACDSYFWSETGLLYTTSGIFDVHYTNAAGCDSVVSLDLTINHSTAQTVSVTACDSYTWAESGLTYTASGSYDMTYSTTTGCDSIITLDLTIENSPVASAVDNGDGTITAGSATSYQWIDCATNAAIAGETNQSYTAVVNGSYAVVVTNGSCSDTSACVVIDYIGIKEPTNTMITLYPNPTSSQVTIAMDSPFARIEVMDAQGKLLQVSTIQNGAKVNLSQYETGIYYFRITTDNGSVLERVTKN